MGQIMWQQHTQEEYWGFLLIDARNAFNEENRTAMLWAVWNECPSGARFAFNFYCQWYTLVIRERDGTGQFLYSKKGVNWGDPMEMVAYGMGILPSSNNCGRLTPASPSPGMWMTLGWAAPSRKSVITLTT